MFHVSFIVLNFSYTLLWADQLRFMAYCEVALSYLLRCIYIRPDGTDVLGLGSVSQTRPARRGMFPRNETVSQKNPQRHMRTMARHREALLFLTLWIACPYFYGLNVLCTVVCLYIYNSVLFKTIFCYLPACQGTLMNNTRPPFR